MRPAARMPKLTRRSRVLIGLALVAVLALLIGPRVVDGYVDWLWFGELGYRSVFTTVLFTRLIVFLVIGLLIGLVVFAGLALAYRSRPVFVPAAGPNDPVARYRTTVLARLRLFGALSRLMGERGFDAITLADIAQAALARHTLAAYPPDLLIEVPRTVCRSLEFHRAAEVIDVGRELTARALDG